jgi:hypothetical protein
MGHTPLALGTAGPRPKHRGDHTHPYWKILTFPPPFIKHILARAELELIN